MKSSMKYDIYSFLMHIWKRWPKGKNDVALRFKFEFWIFELKIVSYENIQIKQL